MNKRQRKKRLSKQLLEIKIMVENERKINPMYPWEWVNLSDYEQTTKKKGS